LPWDEVQGLIRHSYYLVAGVDTALPQFADWGSIVASRVAAFLKLLSNALLVFWVGARS
jgi:hypothetical protein